MHYTGCVKEPNGVFELYELHNSDLCVGQCGNYIKIASEVTMYAMVNSGKETKNTNITKLEVHGQNQKGNTNDDKLNRRRENEIG